MTNSEDPDYSDLGIHACYSDKHTNYFESKKTLSLNPLVTFLLSAASLLIIPIETLSLIYLENQQTTKRLAKLSSMQRVKLRS